MLGCVFLQPTLACYPGFLGRARVRLRDSAGRPSLDRKDSTQALPTLESMCKQPWVPTHLAAQNAAVGLVANAVEEPLHRQVRLLACSKQGRARHIESYSILFTASPPAHPPRTPFPHCFPSPTYRAPPSPPALQALPSVLSLPSPLSSPGPPASQAPLWDPFLCAFPPPPTGLGVEDVQPCQQPLLLVTVSILHASIQVHGNVGVRQHAVLHGAARAHLVAAHQQVHLQQRRRRE